MIDRVRKESSLIMQRNPPEPNEIGGARRSDRDRDSTLGALRSGRRGNIDLLQA